MARIKIAKRPLIKCAACQVKKECISEDGKKYLDCEGEPILFRCPAKEHAFGNWQEVEKCNLYKDR